MPNQIYDNSNLAESYSGITTPLTYSFARYVYERVYEEFCSLMGVSKEKIILNKSMFEQMIVFIGSRLYYNLLNWYRMISFLPGYSFNRDFLEKMLGVEKTYKYRQDKEAENRLFDFFRLSRQISKIVFILINMERLIKNFNKQFDNIYYKINQIDLTKLDDHELEHLYIKTTEKLVGIWKVPIANDLAVMISTGLLGKLGKKWLHDENCASRLNALSHKSLISLDPGKELIEMSEFIKSDKKLKNIFEQKTARDIAKILEKNKRLNFLRNYLNKFGSRTPNELKLESESMNERPDILIKILKKIIKQPHLAKDDFISIRDDYTSLNIFQKTFFLFLKNWSQESIYQREETRLRRSLIFGFARKIFLEKGIRLKNDGKIKDARDIFYLETTEIFNVKNNLEQICQERKNKICNWKDIVLPRRIETKLTISELEKKLRKVKSDSKETKKDFCFGTVASIGGAEFVKGTSLVLTDFDPNANFNNKILVTCQTDPGWTIIFPLLKGIVVERGGMLSHAAIVARELNIPCIVGAEDATKIFSNDKQIQMDLQKGLIKYV